MSRTLQRAAGLALMLAAGSGAGAPAQVPYLSSLQATRHDPLFTTYAAAMERSGFILDEGYHLVHYDTSRGIEFTTDNAGDWALGFKRGSRYVEVLGGLSREPVVTASYADMVRYEYYPFSDLRVTVNFVVASSRLAFQDIEIKNVGNERSTVSLIPFLRNRGRTFSGVRHHPGREAIVFSHEEFPDSWVLDHGVPYVPVVHNVLMFSEPVDRSVSFRSYRWGAVQVPQEIDLARSPVFVVWGRMTHAGGERCQHRSPGVTLTAALNRDPTRILIENAPRWGSSQQNITPGALYGIELGNFGNVKPGDSVTVLLRCGATGEEARIFTAVGDTAKGRSVRIDAVFGPPDAPAPPGGVRRDIWGSGTELRLYWKKAPPGFRYNVYRRDYRAGGLYSLVAGPAEQAFFTEKNITGDRIYGYVVSSVDDRGVPGAHSDEVNNIEGSDFLTDVKFPGQVRSGASDLVRVLGAWKTVELAPGASHRFRVVRGVRRPDESEPELIAAARALLREDPGSYLQANEKLYAGIPEPGFLSPDQRMLYYSAFSLMRQVMLPPEGKCGFNYYVFSREPQWGWGHGGQVFHESLTMLAYALMDPASAMNSQRVYRERQHRDGYINYRTGPYLDETIPFAGQLTTSAPWYAWQNWEVYQLTRDRDFLAEMYVSSRAFHDYYVTNRDSDGDGLCEWGAHAVLESVRDARVAVWDEVGWPSHFEAVDLNAMLVQEEKALGAMARELGKEREAQQWLALAAKRSELVNTLMWDDSTGFYYHLDRKDNDFTFAAPGDLKRREISGLLPLWAGIPDEARARRLVKAITDTTMFWRRFGVPSLAASDPYYNPRGYWNGPVWVEWNYLVQRGLQQYGYHAEAKDLAERVAATMVAQLKTDHDFWEFYDPDRQWGGYHRTYIWAGMIARMLLDAGR